MSILKLESKDYTQMLWKNGKGSTLEIDKGQGWRVSIATVNQDGAFSKFEGMQRIISMISGDAIQLTSSQQDDVIIHTFESHTFNGDEDIYCKVYGEGGQDLNLIYDPKHVKVRFERLCLKTSMQSFTQSDQLFIFNPSENSIKVNVLGQNINLNQHETLKIIIQPKYDGLISFRVSSKEICDLYVIEIINLK